MSTTVKAYDEIVDLFARGFSSADVVKYRPSKSATARARYLLRRTKAGKITAEEQAELDRLGDLEHLMQLVKARARLYAKRSA